MNEKRVQKALKLAQSLYGQDVLEHTPSLTLIEHVCGVLAIFIEFCPDEDAVIACLLQHCLRGKEYSLHMLEEQFGPHVRMIVSRLHLLSHLNSDEWRRSVDDMKIMLVSVADDLRVLILRLCIQAYLLQNIDALEPAYRMRVAREALQLFGPVAARLGIYALKYRLEDRAFPVAYPHDSGNIQSQLSSMHGEHGGFLTDVAAAMETFLRKEGLKARVMAREKHPFSLFQKMQRKSVSDIGKIQDVVAVRVIVQTPEDCYQTLGLLHRIARPVLHRFKDYISFPKPNGYQSLHTCLLGLPNAPPSIMIEVQIRTEAMHREAEYGIAAHWMYKEGGAVQRSTYAFQLADILLKQQSVSTDDDDEEREENLRLSDHIYVLTPRGDIRELPEGSSPLDFAFLIHSDLGLKYKGARVNGVMVPVSHKLENGDVVEILTHPNPRPSWQWLQQLRTPSGKSKLKAYFFAHNRQEFLTRGRDMVNLEFQSRRVPALDADLNALKMFDDHPQSIREREDLLVKIGMGSIKASSILRHIGLDMTAIRKTQGRTPATTRRRALIEIEDSHIDMPFRFAKCCSVDTAKTRPDNIVGLITRTGNISVHKDGCRMVRSANQERKVKVRWRKE